MSTKTKRPEMLLWLSDARGVYIPQNFAQSFVDRDKHVSGVDAETWTILDTGPEHELYWEAWCDVADNAIVTDNDGNKFHIYQEGDCWLVPVGMEWSDEQDTFVWPEDQETED